MSKDGTRHRNQKSMSIRGGGGAGTQRMREISAQHARQKAARKRRDHAARDRDQDRDKLAADVEAFLSAGGEIETVPGYTPGPIRTPAWATDRSRA